MIPTAYLMGSYLLGAIPTSYLVGRWFRGIDLRREGSGNLGATNTFRVMGWKLALPVLIFDLFKGWLPAYLFPKLIGAGSDWGLVFGAAAIIGHVFSIYMRFRGGKGVATSAGVFLAVAPAAALAGLIVWAAIVAGTRIVSLASITAAVVVPVAVWFTQGRGAVLWLSIALAAFVVYAHRANIRRLVTGTEHRFGSDAGGGR